MSLWEKARMRAFEDVALTSILSQWERKQELLEPMIQLVVACRRKR
jgi:hypothetical protein